MLKIIIKGHYAIHTLVKKEMGEKRISLRSQTQDMGQLDFVTDPVVSNFFF